MPVRRTVSSPCASSPCAEPPHALGPTSSPRISPRPHEPDELTREHAAWALSRMGDDRCVPYLLELLRTRGDFTHRPTGSIDRPWNRSDLSLAEALAPFAPLPEDPAAGEQIPHDHRSDAMAVVRRLCRPPRTPRRSHRTCAPSSTPTNAPYATTTGVPSATTRTCVRRPVRSWTPASIPAKDPCFRLPMAADNSPAETHR